MKNTNSLARTLLMVLFVAASVLGGSALWTLNNRVREVNTAEQSDPLWIASQLQFELLRLKDDIRTYLDKETAGEKVLQRFDIAWSRVNVVQTGKMATLVESFRIDDSVITELEATFQELEPTIGALALSTDDTERQALSDRVLTTLEPYDLKLREFALALAQSKARMMSDFRTGALSLSQTLIYLFATIIVLTVIFFAFLIIDLKASRSTAANLQRMAKEAELASAAKDKFMSAVSHELRTPLTSIIGGLKLIRMRFADSHSEQENKILDIAERNCERLMTLVNDILDALRILEGKADLRLAKIDLARTVLTAVEDCQAYASQMGVSYVAEVEDTGLEVLADEDRISQVICNFLSNAAKFTSPGDRVMVRAFATEDTVRVEVEDHGMGIPENEHGNVFTRFHQVNPGESGSKKSSGLGLSISKQIIEMHEGGIGFSSTLGQGSIFWITLKRVPTEAVEVGRAAA